MPTLASCLFSARIIPIRRQHFWPVALSNPQQRFHRDLPICRITLRFRQRSDVFGGVAIRQQLRPSGRMIGSMNRLNHAGDAKIKTR